MNDEKGRQEGFAWARSEMFATYNVVLGRFMAQACLDEVPAGRVLDLACGDGTITAYFAHHYERVVGVDASEKHLAKARERAPNVEFHESLIENFETTERFDGVFMLCLLEHVLDPAAVLQAAARLLKPDGLMVVQVPNAVAINRRIAVRMGTLTACEELSPFDIDIAGHRRAYTLATLAAEVEAAGLRVVRTGGIFYKMLSTAQMDWLLSNGEWEGNVFGWGRVGAEPRDWREEFCRACFETGKERPEDTNIIYACVTAP